MKLEGRNENTEQESKILIELLMSLAFDSFQLYLISNYDFIEHEILYNNREQKLLENTV